MEGQGTGATVRLEAQESASPREPVTRRKFILYNVAASDVEMLAAAANAFSAVSSRRSRSSGNSVSVRRARIAPSKSASSFDR